MFKLEMINKESIEMINKESNMLLPKFNSKQLINEDNNNINNEVVIVEEELKIYNLSNIVNSANLIDLRNHSM